MGAGPRHPLCVRARRRLVLCHPDGLSELWRGLAAGPTLHRAPAAHIRLLRRPDHRGDEGRPAADHRARAHGAHGGQVPDDCAEGLMLLPMLGGFVTNYLAALVQAVYPSFDEM